MDPVSAASAVAGLITLADIVISRTYNAIIACKHASENSRKLLREVQALSGILQSLRTLEDKLGAESLQAKISTPQILACQRSLQRMRDKLEKLDPAAEGISRIQKTMRTLKWPISSSDTDDFLAEMERHKATFDLALSVDALDAILATQQTGGRIAQKIDEVGHFVEKLWRIEQTKQSRQLLHLVGAEDADEPYRINRKLHQHGTGVWFFEEGRPFHRWLTTSGSKLWVYGIPGAGKTILSALAIEEVAKTASVTHGITFYYCSHRVESSRHLSGILKCLIGQFARQSAVCMHLLEEKVGHREESNWQISIHDEDDLLSLLRQMCGVFNSVSLIVDGLDECHDTTSITARFAQLVIDVPHVRMLLFSRREPEMEPLLDSFEDFSIAAESQDLRLYVPAQMEERARLQKLRIKNGDVKDEIVEKLVNGADGMFRWVACQLDHLCTLTTDGERLAALSRLPRSLEETYDRILERVNERGKSAQVLVARTLTWLFGKSPDMDSRQLCQAVSINSGSEHLEPNYVTDVQEILIHCSSLVRCEAGSSTIESAHFTVFEYLQAIDPIQKPHLESYRWDDARAAAYMAETCLTALNFKIMEAEIIDLETMDVALETFPFYSYAAQHWGSDPGIFSETLQLQSMTTRLFCDRQRSNFANWKNVFIFHNLTSGWRCNDNEDPDEYSAKRLRLWITILKQPWESTACHLAAMFHQHHLFTSLLESKLAINESGPLSTPLECAILGDAAMCPSKVQDVLWRTQDPARKITALISTIKTLVDLGADASIECRHLRYSQSIATLASKKCDISIFGQLVTSGLIVDAEAAEYLLRELESTNRKTTDFAFLHTISMDKVMLCDQPAVRRLLTRLEKIENSQRVAISTRPFGLLDSEKRLRSEYLHMLVDACIEDDVEVVRWVFESSDIPVDYEINERKHVTALHGACTCSSLDTVKYLISKGADVNHCAERGYLPLTFLLCPRDSEPGDLVGVLGVLLAANSEALVLDENRNSGLMLCARFENRQSVMIEAFKLLLSHVTSVEHRNDQRRCVWHDIAENPDGIQLAQLLRDRLTEIDLRESINWADDNGCTALHIAVSKAHMDNIEFLLDNGADPTAETADGDSALYVAADNFHVSNKPLEAVMQSEKFTVADPTVFANAIRRASLSLCIDHWQSSGEMPSDQIQALITLEWTASESLLGILNAGDGSCIAMLAKHLVAYCDHDLRTCKHCAVRLEIFLVLIRGEFADGQSTTYRTTCLELILNGLRARRARLSAPLPEESACTKALCELLGLHIDAPEHQALVLSAFEIVTQLGHEKLIQTCLDAGLDVDQRCMTSQQLTPLQYLCEHHAPESAVKTAISRTKKLHSRNAFGDNLLHSLLRYATPSPSSTATQVTLVGLIVEAGIDIDARCGSDQMTALMMAARIATSTFVRILLKRRADVTPCDQRGSNAMTYAILSNCQDSVQLLLDHECPVVYSCFSVSPFRPGWCMLWGPLQHAATLNTPAILQILSRRLSIDVEKERKLKVLSPLWIACMAPRTWVVEVLLAEGADLRYQDPIDGMTPLHVAAANGYSEIVEILIDAGSDAESLDNYGLTPRVHAMVGGHQAIAEQLIPSDISGSIPNLSTMTLQKPLGRLTLLNKIPDPIYGIIQRGELSNLKRLCSNGVNMALQFKSCDCTPMGVALAAGQVAIVTYLQDLGVDVVGHLCWKYVSPRCPTISLVASRQAMAEPLHGLIRSLSHVSVRNWTQMMHASAAAGNVPTLRILLDADQKHDERHPPEQTPVHLSTGQICRFLFYASGSALHTAVQSGQYWSVRFLLDRGFDPNELDHFGNAPAHIAAESASVGILRLLLYRSAVLNVRNRAMCTPLIIAARAGCRDIVSLLLELGADVLAINDLGASAFSMAASRYDFGLSFSLLQAGSRPAPIDVLNLYANGFRAFIMLPNILSELIEDPRLLSLVANVSSTRAMLKLVPPHLLQRHLAARFDRNSSTALYCAVYRGLHDVSKLFHDAGAMLNQEGGLEGTPVMVACKSGRFEAVKYLVRNGALIVYSKGSETVSAFEKAKSYPNIRRWLLVERFTDQRRIVLVPIRENKTGDDTHVLKRKTINEETSRSVDVEAPPLDLILEEDVEPYLASRNWFLPLRRFVDQGDGTFDELPLDPSDFWKFRPASLLKRRTCPV